MAHPTNSDVMGRDDAYRGEAGFDGAPLAPAMGVLTGRQGGARAAADPLDYGLH